jgi:hypothetical protein
MLVWRRLLGVGQVAIRLFGVVMSINSVSNICSPTTTISGSRGQNVTAFDIPEGSTSHTTRQADRFTQLDLRIENARMQAEEARTRAKSSMVKGHLQQMPRRPH